MDMISKDSWEDYIDKLNRVNTKAADEMLAWTEKYGYDYPAIVDQAFAIATRYGEGAAALACEMCDEMAELQGIYIPPTEPAEAKSYEYVKAAVDDKIEKGQESKIPDTVAEIVKRRGAETTLKAARYYNAWFAWVPHGNPCAFCRMLASNGWQRASKKSKFSHATHIHAHCSCEYAISFQGPYEIGGYDPDKYLEEYESYSGSAEARLKAMRSQDRRQKAGQDENEVKVPKKFDGNFDDYLPLSIGKEERAVLSGLNQKARETGYEHAQIISENGKSAIFTSNDKNGVGINLDIIDGEHLKVYHSHTNLTPLSKKDFRFLCDERVEEIGNVASNGDAFIARIGNGYRPSIEEFESVINDDFQAMINGEIASDPERFGLSFDSSPEEYTYVAIREQAFQIAASFGWEYEGGRIE